MKKIREEFADTMLEIGPTDERLVVMVGDISHGILQPFAKACPGRYYNIGICEPTIVNMAAGMAMVGLIPVVHTIAPFITERAYEQIKLDFGYQELSGNIVSVGGAFDYSQLGCSHHCYTDVSLFCHLKRASVVMPGSPIEFNKLFKDTYASDGIHYFRVPEYDHGVDFAATELTFGKALRLREGNAITLLAAGPQLRSVLVAAERLASLGYDAEVLYYHTIKPFDAEAFRASVQKTKRFVCVEELSAHDGLFNLCLRAALGIELRGATQIAIEDFIHGYGSYEELCARLGLCPDGVQSAALRLLNNP